MGPMYRLRADRGGRLCSLLGRPAKSSGDSVAWKEGESGNPLGKPPGARNEATVMVLGLMELGEKEIDSRQAAAPLR